MRRADRLLQILMLLRGRRRTTAAQLAQWLEVSPRTVYRDMADLMQSGAPVNGESGEGYWLEAGFTPPPLSFSAAELAALEVGARLLAAWGDPASGDAAASALGKIHAVLGSAGLTPAPLFAPGLHDYPRHNLSQLTTAINQRHCLSTDYCDEAGRHSQRSAQPWPADISLDAFLRHADVGSAARRQLEQQIRQPWHQESPPWKQD